MTVFKLLDTAKHYIKNKPYTIDNFPFQLFYRYTFAIHLVFCALLSANQYFGKHIQCTAEKDNDEKLLNEYCWISGTWTVQDKEPHELAETIDPTWVLKSLKC